MFSPIIRNSWQYLQPQVVFTQVAAGWCLGWFETAASQLRCCIITGHGGHSMDTEATRHFRARGFFGDFYLRNLSALRQKLIHVSLKIIQRIDKKKVIRFYVSSWRPPLVSFNSSTTPAGSNLVNTTRSCKYSQLLLMMGKTSLEACRADLLTPWSRVLLEKLTSKLCS